MVEAIKNNAIDLNLDLQWLDQVIDTRLLLHFNKDCIYKNVFEVFPHEFTGEQSVYANFVNHYNLTFAERLTLIISLAPHIKPQILDKFFIKNDTYERGFTEFGGLKGNYHGGFLPTGETLVFILADEDLEMRFSLYKLFNEEHFFYRHNILSLEKLSDNEPAMSGTLKLSPEYLSYFTTGEEYKPDFSINFPAKYISTDVTWDDLVLDPLTLKQIDEIKAFIHHGNRLMRDWEMARKLRPGHRCLFYGPPGTGKTMTACLLGKYTGRTVYKIDLSMVVSKYIGETEKNLSKVFQQAEHKNWILFFDEADALFGKRTKIEDAHDRFANQEVSYLLQRIESFDGVVILASNMKTNLDDAFTRRFESVIYFAMPKIEERQRIWEQGFSPASVLAATVDLHKISKQYEIAGGAIMNVIRYASLMSINKGSNVITLENIEEGIKKEYHKEGRTI
jgi:AAA+ superfamily predicted ATPase